MVKAYVMVGSRCNLSCPYCTQSHKEELPTTINPDIYKYIFDKGPAEVVFFGGEPLLYFDKIKEVVENILKLLPTMQFNIVTNGLLLNEEICNWLNENEIKINISADLTRSGNVLARETSLLPNKMSVLSVMDDISTPKKVISLWKDFLERYQKKHDGKRCGFMMMPRRGHKCNNLDQIQEEVKEITLTLIEGEFIDESLFIYKKFLTGLLRKGKIYEPQKYHIDEPWSPRCAVSEGSFSLDLAGNLYGCNTMFDKKIGDIYKGETPDWTEYDCSGCIARGYCRGGCKYEFSEDYCELNRAIVKGYNSAFE